MNHGTEKPTPAHLRKLRDRGYVPRSAAFTRAMGFVLAALTTPLLLERVLTHQRDYLLELFTQIRVYPEIELTGLSQRLTYSTFVPVVLFLLVVVTGHGLVGIVQSGGIFRPFAGAHPPRARASVPRASGIKLSEPVGSFASILFVFALTLAVLFYYGNTVVYALGNFDRLTSIALLLSRRLLTLFALSALTLALIQYGYTIYAYRKQSKMTLAQVKQEQREQYGSKEISSERKRLLTELASAPLDHILPFSNLAIDDGSTLVVLLAYDPRLDDAPRILKSVRHVDRERVLSLIHRPSTPVVIDEWLANRLSSLMPNAPIPLELLAALAEAWSATTRPPGIARGSAP